MRKIIFTLIVSFFATSNFAQKVESNNVNNGIRRISTKETTINLSNDFNIKLELFLDNDNNEQFFIKGESEINEYHNIPEHGKLMFKTFDGSIIELTACYSELSQVSETSWMPTAYYPISKDNLDKIIEGIAKIRVELLSYNKKEKSVYTDIQDIDYKKDKVGEKISLMCQAINKEVEKIKKNNSSLNIDATAGF